MCFKRKKKEDNVEVKEKKNDVKDNKFKKVEEDEKTKKAVYRVVFSKEQKVWQIKKDGAKRVIDSRPTKEEALNRVKELSQSQDTKFIVHKKDGKFQKKSNIR